MKQITDYITEKLYINKNSKTKEINSKYGLHENSVADKILYFTDIRDNGSIEKYIEEWIKNYNIKDVKPYTSEESAAKLGISSDKIRNIDIMNNFSLKDYIDKHCKLNYMDKKMRLYTSDKSICFVFTEKNDFNIFIVFKKY